MEQGYSMTHSLLPPSKAARRMACPGSRLLESKIPVDTESNYAKEGSIAHQVAAQILKNIREGYSDLDLEPTDTITQEMIDGAILYSEFILSKIAPFTRESVYVEERISISTIHPECWGTPDAWHYNMLQELNIFDYKYGHSFVEVFENWQLMEYAAGILEHLKINGIQDQHLFVNFHIIQPRSYHPEGPIRSWRTKASGLRPYFNKLKESEYAAMSEKPNCYPSSECNHCSARHACHVLQSSSLTSIAHASLAVLCNLSPDQVGNELRLLENSAELLNARITGLQAEALSLIQAGHAIPHYHAEYASGRQQWKIPDDQVIEIGELVEINLAKPVSVVTPKQAIALGMNKKIIDKISEIKYGDLKLVPTESKKLRKIFEG